jgi:hypothetical protein
VLSTTGGKHNVEAKFSQTLGKVGNGPSNRLNCHKGHKPMTLCRASSTNPTLLPCFFRPWPWCLLMGF